MSKTVSQLKDSISGLLQGANLDNVTNLNGAIERAARTLILRASVPETMGRQNVTLYDGVYDYIAPTSIFGTSIIDIRPQGVSRSFNDYVYRTPIQTFDREKGLLDNGTEITFEFNKGVALMRIVQKTSPKMKAQLDGMSSTTGWTLAGSGSSLTTDTIVFYQEPASLKFTLTGSSLGTLTKTLTSSIDLTTYQGVGVVFVAVYIPSTGVSSINLRLGSDSSNYYSVTATQGFLGAFKTGQWQLVPFDLATATTVGSPVITATDYIYLGITHTATQTNFRAGTIFISYPILSEIIYQSAAMFIPAAGGDPLTTITLDSDTVYLNDGAYTLLEYEGALTVAAQSGGRLGGGVVAQIGGTLNGARTRTGQVIQLGLYDLYRSANPAEEIRTTNSYYDVNG